MLHHHEPYSNAPMIPIDDPSPLCTTPHTSLHLLTLHLTPHRTSHLSPQDLIRALLAKEPSDRPSIADIFDHRWLRSRYSGDSKELSSTSKSGANITFRNFEEYCGRGKFPETDTWKIDSALEIERRNKSVNLSTDNNSTATTHSAGTSASTSSSTRIDYQITRRKSLSADGEKDKAKDRERERNRERERDRDRSGASPSQAALSLKRRDKGMGGSQALPSFRRHRNDVSPSGARRAGRQDRESVSERSIGTIKILPDLTSSSFSDKDVSSKQAKAKRGSKQLIPIPSDLVRGRDRDPSDRDRDRERETSRHSADLKDHHRIHLRPI